jgi:hypothetical protein
MHRPIGMEGRPMEHNLGHTMSLLARTPATLEALLSDLPEAWTLTNEGEGTWSAFDIVGHLLHADRTNWMPRARFILQFGDSRPFEPFDRLGHAQASKRKSLRDLLNEFTLVRSENLRELRVLNLSPEDLKRKGQHPALGSATLSQLLAAWVAHDLTHLHQLTRVMAHQYREAVGPWSKFLGVMRCEGRSAAA